MSIRSYRCRMVIVSAMLCVVGLTSCDYIESLRRRVTVPTEVIASIGDEHLYRSEIELLVPPGTSKMDSIAIVEDYIRAWATDILMYRNARRNVKDEAEIQRLVEDYERTITIHYYRQNMVKEKVNMPTDDEAAEYWEAHKQEFVLSEPAVKGMVVSLPIGTNNIAALRRKMKNPEKNIAEIENFALRHAVVYSLFTDDWQLLSAIEKSTGRRLPVDNTGYFETTDSAAVNMIFISEFTASQQPAPLSMAMEDARLRLFQLRKMQYLRNMDDEIYEHALSHGEIKINRGVSEVDTVVTDSVVAGVPEVMADSSGVF